MQTWIVFENGRRVGETQAVSMEKAINNVRFNICRGNRLEMYKRPAAAFRAYTEAELESARMTRLSRSG